MHTEAKANERKKHKAPFVDTCYFPKSNKELKCYLENDGDKEHSSPLGSESDGNLQASSKLHNKRDPLLDCNKMVMTY